MISAIINITEKDVIIEIRRVYFDFFEGSYMTLDKFNLHSKINQSMILKYFDTWVIALKKAGINSIPTVKLSNEERQKIIVDLNKIKAINKGEYFYYEFYQKNNGQYLRKDILLSLNYMNWNLLLNKELKLFRKRKGNGLLKRRALYTKEELFAELKRVWKIFGRQPTGIEFEECSPIDMSFYEKKFGTWTACIENFCLKNTNFTHPEIGKKFHVSKKLLLEEIKLIKQTNSRVNLTFKDFKELGGNFTKEAFNTHFGSWENALEFYEIKFTDNFRLPEDKLLLVELQNIIETLGRNPSAQEMENIGKYPYRYYINRFGGVKKCLSVLAESTERTIQ